MIQGFHLLIAAQFVSGLADNALLLVTLARLLHEGAPAWLLPLLKLVFTLAYVVLAPFVGVLADRWPKARVMMAANATKAAACAALALGAPAAWSTTTCFRPARMRCTTTAAKCALSPSATPGPP